MHIAWLLAISSLIKAIPKSLFIVLLRTKGHYSSPSVSGIELYASLLAGFAYAAIQNHLADIEK